MHGQLKRVMVSQKVGASLMGRMLAGTVEGPIGQTEAVVAAGNGATSKAAPDTPKSRGCQANGSKATTNGAGSFTDSDCRIAEAVCVGRRRSNVQFWTG